VYINGLHAQRTCVDHWHKITPKYKNQRWST